MEEILASIRRIIADEGGAPGKSSALSVASARPPLARAPDEDILELTEAVAAASDFTAIEPDDVAFRDDSEVESEPVPEPEEQDLAATTSEAFDDLKLPDSMPARAPVESFEPRIAPRRSPVMRDQELMSPDATAAVSAAFGSLANTILSENSRTLEDLVKEMMRPMLKEWLDDNLPGLVERMVRAEIERVARGR